MKVRVKQFAGKINLSDMKSVDDGLLKLVEVPYKIKKSDYKVGDMVYDLNMNKIGVVEHLGEPITNYVDTPYYDEVKRQRDRYKFNYYFMVVNRHGEYYALPFIKDELIFMDKSTEDRYNKVIKELEGRDFYTLMLHRAMRHIGKYKY